MDDQLFHSTHAALTFAYNFQGSPALSVMNRMANKPGPMGKGLAGLDGAGQAGIIRWHVASLGKFHESIIIAEFAPKSQPCSCGSLCCIGKMRNQEWTAAVGYIADIVRTEAIGDHSTTQPVRRACTERFFGARFDINKTAENLAISRNTLALLIGKTRKYLRCEQDKAARAIDEKLKCLVIQI